MAGCVVVDLILTGVEKMRVVPGFTQASALDLYYMPYTHSLAGALILSAALGGIVAAFMKQQRALAFFVVAAAAFSHWIADLIVHVPDLPLYDNTLKVGFGMWRHLWMSLPLELAFLIVGAWFYTRYVPAKPRGNLWLWVFVGAMAAVEIYNTTFAPPPSEQRKLRHHGTCGLWRAGGAGGYRRSHQNLISRGKNQPA